MLFVFKIQQLRDQFSLAIKASQKDTARRLNLHFKSTASAFESFNTDTIP